MKNGRTPTSYEPYGASPSPDYPSEIHSVADDVNLYDIENANVSNLGSNITVTKENDTVKMVCNGNVYGAILGNVTLGKVQEYTIACDVEGGVETQLQWGLRVKFQDNTYSNVSNSNKLTFTTNQKNEQIQLMFYVRVGQDFTGTVILSNIKLQEGTVATPYSPYNQGTVTIKQRGKNLFDTSNIISSVTDYTITVQDGGFIIRTGGMSNGGNLGLLKNLCPQLKVGDKFKFNWDTNATRNNSDVNYIYLNLYRNTIVKDILYTCTQEMLDSETYFYGQQGEYYKDIIFYLDGQTSDYEPYQGNDYTIQTEPLRSLPNGVKDTIEADGIHRRVGRIVLDGTEPWQQYNNNVYFVGINRR